MINFKKLHHYLPKPILAYLKTWHDDEWVKRTHELSLKHLRSCAEQITEQCLSDISTLNEWQQHRPALLSQLQWMLGLDRLPMRTPLNPQVTGSLDRFRYRVEKLVFQSLPSLYVTANFYIPKEISTPVPCVLYLCGHQIHPLGAKTQYQERFLWYPEHGFACLVLDSLLCSEVPGWHGGTHRHNQWDWLSLGYTPAAVEIWNAMRALDYLASRVEVDSERIGVTGVSGGGVMTWYLTALDERVKAAAPSCSTYTIGSQAALDLIGSQCDCTFYPNIYRLDFPTVGALIAPRPLLITSGKKDRIFPPLGYREVFRRVKAIYDLYDEDTLHRKRVKAVESNTGHTDPPLFLRESRQWMCQWLHPEPSKVLGGVDEPVAALEPAESLACLQGIPEDVVNFTIHHHFIRAKLPEIPETLEAWQSRRSELLQALHQTVFSWFPAAPGPVLGRRMYGSGGHAARFANFSEWRIETEPGVKVLARLFQPRNAEQSSSLLVVVRRLGDCAAILDDELLPLFSHHNVIVLNPRFTESMLNPERYAVIERMAALCGRTIAALQVWDLMRALQWALNTLAKEPDQVSVYGRGSAGIIALYAALLTPRINQVILRDPPASHREGPALLTVLRTTDIPEVAAALAPRTLSFLSDIPEPFSFTRKVYRLCGAEDKVQRFATLPTALAPRIIS